MSTLASLREQLKGRRVVEVFGRDDDGVLELHSLEFDDGTILRPLWRAGSSDGFVGVAVGRARPRPASRRRPVVCAS
jgi:hypothetical protein